MIVLCGSSYDSCLSLICFGANTDDPRFVGLGRDVISASSSAVDHDQLFQALICFSFANMEACSEELLPLMLCCLCRRG